jgi:hypothetical protein
MKKGDMVVINDGSWSRTVKNNKLVHGPGSDRYRASRDRKHYTVIETGCSFPNTGNQGYGEYLGRPTFNNTVIQAIDSGKVVFIEEHFLELVPSTHRVMIDIDQIASSTVVEISDKLYKEIKRGS